MLRNQIQDADQELPGFRLRGNPACRIPCLLSRHLFLQPRPLTTIFSLFHTNKYSLSRMSLQPYVYPISASACKHGWHLCNINFAIILSSKEFGFNKIFCLLLRIISTTTIIIIIIKLLQRVGISFLIFNPYIQLSK